MRQFLVDTDIVIDVGRQQQYALKIFEYIANNGEAYLSVVSSMELLVGCRNKTEVRHLKNYLKEFTILQINDSVSTAAFDLLQKYRLSHGLLIADALIAATSLLYSIPLITHNQKDFRFIKEIELMPLP